jgi:hypothetical protein
MGRLGLIGPVPFRLQRRQGQGFLPPMDLCLNRRAAGSSIDFLRMRRHRAPPRLVCLLPWDLITGVDAGSIGGQVCNILDNL